MPPLLFGHELDEALIELVKNKTYLWDPNQTKYADGDEKEKTWKKIGAELNRSGAACKSRWVNIRDQMRRKYRERLENKRGATQKYKYENNLDFIIPYFNFSGVNSQRNDCVYFSDGEDTNYSMADDTQLGSGEEREDDPMDNKDLVQKDSVLAHFGHKLDEALIKEVKKNNLLWDPKQTKYTDSNERKETWKKIGAELNRSGAACRTRWINIRDQMRRIHRQRIKNKRCTTQKYKYENELSFVIPLFNCSAVKSQRKDSVYFSDDGEDTNCSMADDTQPDSAEDREDDPMDNKDLVQKDSLLIETVESRWLTSNSSNAGPSSAQTVLNVSDSIDVFLFGIGTSLRTFSPFYQNQAKAKIFQIISEYELEQIIEKRNETKCPLDMISSP